MTVTGQAIPLLEARNVTVVYPGQPEAAVRNVSIAIDQGDALGIVGETGSGKTTLARVLAGALTPTSGSVLVSGRPWSAVRRTDPVRRSVQMVFQDPYGSLNPWKTASQAVADVLRQWSALDRHRADAAAAALLAEVGLPADAKQRRPAKLSGGQCQRVGIARALACEPEVLLADEPTSSLDVSVQAQILNLLRSLREKRSLAVVLVSHDLMVVNYMTTEAIVMYRGQVVEHGPTRELMHQPMHPYTRILIDSIPGRDGGSGFTSNDAPAASGCVFAQRCPRMQTSCTQRRPDLQAYGPKHSVACHYPLNATNGEQPSHVTPSFEDLTP